MEKKAKDSSQKKSASKSLTAAKLKEIPTQVSPPTQLTRLWLIHTILLQKTKAKKVAPQQKPEVIDSDSSDDSDSSVSIPSPKTNGKSAVKVSDFP